MCLISCAPKGTDKYSDRFINGIIKGATNNNDGYGYMVKYDGDNCIYYSKNFDNINDLITEIKSFEIKDSDELIVHSRAGNKGNKDKANAHPFILTDSSEEIGQLFGSTQKPMMCHNGTFHYYGTHNSIYSDTYHFIRQFMCIPEFISLLKRDQELFQVIFKSTLGTNKLAFLFPDSDMIMLGNFEKDDGYFHSNMSYKDVKIHDSGRHTKYLASPVTHNCLTAKNLKLFNDSYNVADAFSRNNKYGIRINNFTKNDIYLVCIKDSNYVKLNQSYVVNPYKFILSNEKAVWITETTDAFAQGDNRVMSPSAWSDLVFADELKNNFTISPIPSKADKYKGYALLKTLSNPLSNKRMKKLFKAYNNSLKKTTTTVKIENSQYFIPRESLQLFLFENYKEFKNCSNYVGIIEKEAETELARIKSIMPKSEMSERNISILT